jgi:nucleotide sugar dehydrogenase
VSGRAAWSGDPGSSGTVSVVGLGKIGLPLVAQYAAAGWHVIGVDVSPAVVAAIDSGRSHIDEEPELADRIAAAHAADRLEATLDHADAARRSDVVILIVPLTLDASSGPDYRAIDAATQAIGRGLSSGTLVIYETTLPVGDTRGRFGPLLESASGLRLGDGGFLLAFSPERVSSGRVFRDLATYPKLVGGVDERSTERAIAFYRSVLPAEVWDLGSSETAEFAKLAETTYRDVNIALANEFARYAERVGVDILEVIRGANSQPYSHIHKPGLGVGGHCIPVYPNFLLSRAPDLRLVTSARHVNDQQVASAVDAIEAQLASGLAGTQVLVLGLTYRENVHELAYSLALPLIDLLQARGADVAACDPLLGPEEVRSSGARPYVWGSRSDAGVIITQTADPLWADLDLDWFPRLSVIFDGRNSLPERFRTAGPAYLGVGRSAVRSLAPAAT